ncbi:Zn-dependent proteases [Kingella potus]|uniref:Zn-dependent proteases n=1 Tax=Kingella potus TaxID=265175 RepID=A0A377R2P7_9NEIS|nr:site-2 protease family protein [Kingella potus]STR03170.1 Zn-dependent proteases [Kingella potus]
MKFDPAQILLMIAPILLAITLSEAARAYAARYWGDNTAEKFGRLSLNPIVHIDILGTIIVPAILILTGAPFLFGWAKPVPVNSRNLRNIRLGIRSISAAGLLANLLMMYCWGLLLSLVPIVPASFREPLSGMAGYGISFNAILFVLNALPILPFDGGRFIDTFLPAKWSVQFQKTARYGTWVILILLITGILGYLILPLASVLSYTAYFIATLIGSLFLL